MRVHSEHEYVFVKGVHPMQRKTDEESPPVFRMQLWKSKLKDGTETEGGCCARVFKADNARTWSTCSGLCPN
jgi:hypothetical protein